MESAIDSLNSSSDWLALTPSLLPRPAVLQGSGLAVEEHTPEEEVEQFRQFLDTVSADDFVAGDEGEEGTVNPS